MAWTTIPPTATDPDAPLTSFIAKAWTDNPAAIANGDAGAPRIADAALNSTLAGVTAAGSTWVGRRYAGVAADGVGMIRPFRWGGGVLPAVGAVVPGGTIVAGLSGSWAFLGACAGPDPVAPSHCLWQRVS